MVMEVQPNQVNRLMEEELNSVSDMDVKIKAVEGQESPVPIKFGKVSDKNVADEPTKGDLDLNEANKLPKNAVDEWPEVNQIRSLYFVRYRPYDDPKIKAKIDQADKEIQKKRQARTQIIDALRTKRTERSDIISQLKPLTTEDKNFRAIIDEKRKEMEPFQAALTKLRTVESSRKSEGLCSSEDELNNCIKALHFRLQHESNTIAEEKQMLKEIKYLEGTREKVIATAAMTAKIGDSFGQKDDVRGQVKQLGVNLDAVRKDQQAVRAKIKKLEEKLEVVNGEISSLEEELAEAEQKTNKAFETIRELRKARDDTNSCFQKNRTLLNTVRELAAKKDIVSLEELYHSEVEKFMSQWNVNKSFRDDYARRILSSLDARQLSRDGRMRNPDEKPIVFEVAAPIEVEPPKITTKRAKDDTTLPLQHDIVSSKKVPKDDDKKPTDADTKVKATALEDKEVSPLPGDSKDSIVVKEIDAEQLKEMKKAEEIIKAKQAMERKKKLAEKAAAKAAAKAQKEAEKKLKEKEKKARKKGAPYSEVDPVEQAQEETSIEEPVEPDAIKEKEAPVPAKTKKESKDNVRFRGRQRSSGQPPKFIVNRKKSQSYWIWVAPAVALVVGLAAIGIYYSFLKN